MSVIRHAVCLLICLLIPPATATITGTVTVGAKAPPHCVATIASLQVPQSSPFVERQKMPKQAVTAGANVLVAPQDHGSNSSALAHFATLAEQLGVAIVGTHKSVNGGETSAVLFDNSGRAVLGYSKRRGSYDTPTAGENRTAALLDLGCNFPVRIALQLGTDFLFPETARSLLGSGVQLVLAPMAWNFEPQLIFPRLSTHASARRHIRTHNTHS